MTGIRRRALALGFALGVYFLPILAALLVLYARAGKRTARLGRLETEAKARRAERLARLRPGLRDDLPIESVVMFLNFVANAFAFARVIEDTLPDLDVLMELVETGVAPR